VSLLIKSWRMLPTRLRLGLARAVEHNRRLYRWVMFTQADYQDRAKPWLAGIPPARLRYRVAGIPDGESFVEVGKVCAAEIQQALARAGRDLGSFTRILDFGCGCGRALVHMQRLAPKARWDGTDIDRKAIAWCRRHLPFATFTVNPATPPSHYPADTFDLIYVISVFTHLNEDYQFRWLEELRRIARPGAALVVSLHSPKEGKPFFYEHSYERGLFPRWYQNTYHSEAYVREHFGKYFTVLTWIPKGLKNHQDVVVLEKPRTTS
jgi:SAM-dependent methyltransferase